MSLYKYVVPERFDILKGARVRFTQPSALNDPYEMKPYFDAIMETGEIKENLNKARKSITDQGIEQAVDIIIKDFPAMSREQCLAIVKQATKKHSPQIEQKLTEQINLLVDTAADLNPVSRKLFYESLDKHIGVFCLAETATNLLMWTHYAQNHQGFLIEFNEEHEFFHRQKFSGDDTGCLHRVVYVGARPHYKTIKELSSADMFLTKGEHWAYEQEWRMLLPLKEADHRIGEVIYLFDIPPNCITGLILGSNMQNEMRQTITDFVRCDARYTHVKLCQASISDTDFEICIV